MFGLMLVTLIAAPPKLAAPGLVCADFSPPACDALSVHLVQQLGTHGVPVVSAQDIANTLGLERQKQLMGCSDSSCSAEIAGALGVDGIVTGNVAKVGDSVIVNVRVISAKDAKALASFSESTTGIDSVPRTLERGAALVAATLTGTETRQGVSRAWALVPGGVAVLTGVGAAVAFAAAGGAQNELDTSMNAPANFDVAVVQARGRSAVTAGAILTGVASASAATAIVLLLVGQSPSPPKVALVPSINSFGVVFSGEIP